MQPELPNKGGSRLGKAKKNRLRLHSKGCGSATLDTLGGMHQVHEYTRGQEELHAVLKLHTSIIITNIYANVNLSQFKLIG